MANASKRRQPITLATIAGMLKSAAIINEHFNTRFKQEVTESGSVVRPPTEEEKDALQFHKGASALGVSLSERYSGNYSIGMYQSAQVLVGLAAELALKFAYEQENPNISAPNSHDLFDLYHNLSRERKCGIEFDYSRRIPSASEYAAPKLANGRRSLQSGSQPLCRLALFIRRETHWILSTSILARSDLQFMQDTRPEYKLGQ